MAMRRRLWIGLVLGGGIVIGLAAALGVTRSRPDVAQESMLAPVDFPFALREPVTFAIDFSQHSVCDSRFAGGQVVDQDGQPVDGLAIEVRAGSPSAASEAVVRVVSGDAPEIGPGGWHASLFRLGEADAYTAALRDAAGDRLAAPVSFAFPPNCAENMAVLTFVRVRPDGG